MGECDHRRVALDDGHDEFVAEPVELVSTRLVLGQRTRNGSAASGQLGRALDAPKGGSAGRSFAAENGGGLAADFSESTRSGAHRSGRGPTHRARGNAGELGWNRFLVDGR